jgi:hypothetical protein
VTGESRRSDDGFIRLGTQIGIGFQRPRWCGERFGRLLRDVRASVPDAQMTVEASMRLVSLPSRSSI